MDAADGGRRCLQVVRLVGGVPTTLVYLAKDPAPAVQPRKEPPAKVDPKDAIKEVAGTAEFLRNTPKHYATFKGYDAKARTVTLLIDGEKVPKAWPLLPDAEVKVNGWWGRADQLKVGRAFGRGSRAIARRTREPC